MLDQLTSLTLVREQDNIWTTVACILNDLNHVFHFYIPVDQAVKTTRDIREGLVSQPFADADKVVTIQARKMLVVTLRPVQSENGHKEGVWTEYEIPLDYVEIGDLIEKSLGKRNGDAIYVTPEDIKETREMIRSMNNIVFGNDAVRDLFMKKQAESKTLRDCYYGVREWANNIHKHSVIYVWFDGFGTPTENFAWEIRVGDVSRHNGLWHTSDGMIYTSHS